MIDQRNVSILGFWSRHKEILWRGTQASADHKEEEKTIRSWWAKEQQILGEKIQK